MNKIKTKLLTITFSLITILALGLVNTTSINNLSQTQQPTQFNINSTIKEESIELTDIKLHSVKINFELKDNNNVNNIMVVKIRSATGGGGKVGRKENVKNKDFITAQGLDSNTKYQLSLYLEGENKTVDTKPFKTKPIPSKIEYVDITKGPETNSLKIHFNVTKDDGGGNVVIKDNYGWELGSKDNVDGPGSIIIRHIEPGTIYSNWTMTLDGSDVTTTIPDFNSLGEIKRPIHPEPPTSPSTPIWLIIIITIASTLGATIGGFAIYSTIKKQK